MEMNKLEFLNIQIDNMHKIKERILRGDDITFEEAIVLSKVKEKEELYSNANDIRKHYTGNKIDLCTIMNARSGKCSENCKWCAQSAYHNTSVQIYDIVDKKDAIKQACHNEKKGAHKFSLVTSGRTLTDANLELILDIYRDVKKETKLHLCASHGLLNKDQLKKLKDTGIKHYHCNLETAPSFFQQLCTTHAIEEKLNTIRAAREVGLEICSGGIIGMGETMEQRIELAFELKKIHADSIPLNILNPIQGTRLEHMPPLSDEEILTTIALFRIINPSSLIRFAGGRNLISHMEDKALNAGINAALVGDLLTTVGKNIDEDLRDFERLGFDITKESYD